MSDELTKELSRIQLLSSRCKNKISMCPLSITLEENRAYLIFNYIKELKKQLEELKSTNKVLSEKLTKDKILKQDCLTTCCGIPIGDIPKLINQQKEFIKYLEDEFTKIQNDIEKEIDNNVKYFKVERRQIITEILQKYKKIIGDDK